MFGNCGWQDVLSGGGGGGLSLRLSLSLGPFLDPTVEGLARVCRSCWWCRVETWASHVCLPLAMLDLCALW